MTKEWFSNSEWSYSYYEATAGNDFLYAEHPNGHKVTLHCTDEKHMIGWLEHIVREIDRTLRRSVTEW